MLSAIILAAGEGKRLNTAVSKPLVKIGSKPAIIYSLNSLNKHPDVDEIIVVLSLANQGKIIKVIEGHSFEKIKVFVLGGRRRQDSVYSGLKVVSKDSNWVLIHDSARPFIDGKSITKVIAAAKKSGAALLAVRPKATIKFSRQGNVVTETLNRNKLWEAQTPQVFKKNLLLEAYKKYSQDNVTDDASLVEKLGKRVKVVEGDYGNIKITTSEDLLVAGLIIRKKAHAI
ncbi:MAG: 2-C-methyl-D-erythritol 4-phosphate cytidylyltransferase [Candidatus Omnitrophica bacterium]|nr:2-C-methyl-D-erythritol 4-phosphate cytidylyltransferase [Candidatus Omnitrophota bacterium]MBU1924094.1 2-C-methyl-D-erythritol 4-phosphate cytidylyltransferase [Candidatus Omnitrophota bacterium]